jgi:hypothetical protein
MAQFGSAMRKIFDDRYFFGDKYIFDDGQFYPSHSPLVTSMLFSESASIAPTFSTIKFSPEIQSIQT